MSSPVLDCFDGSLSVSTHTTADNKATIPAKMRFFRFVVEGEGLVS
jgi:hypothetical protein